MPLTVITLKSVPPALRGDLSKWMQEIATGVFIGNFNRRVRAQLWQRVQDSVGGGEATMSYAYRNEIGYHFETLNAQREVVDFDGVPLVRLPNQPTEQSSHKQFGYSDAAKFRKIRKFSTASTLPSSQSFVVLDIETDGLDEQKNDIIEVGAIKVTSTKTEEFQRLVAYDKILPKEIVQLTGITTELLAQEGEALQEVSQDLRTFVGDLPIVGYAVRFDMAFINQKLLDLNLPLLVNPVHDIMRDVKSEKLFLDNYKLQTVLQAYGIEETVPHRALLDAQLILTLALKVNKFLKWRDQK
ncbi:type I-E CRISPR-associated endoribonuclease Cas2e [Streptococcus pluranimalium]|uniref:type I-E CRISPR-associated endoribonuclease Cas2e n=1 Tax=Streptococcus pluranimalium TaxID=82348 RepID=UPI0039FCA312